MQGAGVGQAGVGGYGGGLGPGGVVMRGMRSGEEVVW